LNLSSVNATTALLDSNHQVRFRKQTNAMLNIPLTIYNISQIYSLFMPTNN